MQSIPRWGRVEFALTSTHDYPNPPQDAALEAEFTGPSGQVQRVAGFWDGGQSWRVRFRPGEVGRWRYATSCSDGANAGLHNQSGAFDCAPSPSPATRFEQHGPVGLAPNRRHLAHADGLPYLWLGDTVWNGPLLATDEEWAYYLRERARQGFTGAQWVATHWFVSPQGDREGQRAFEGRDQIRLNPAFFQRLDGRVAALNAAGLLAAPVLLWAALWGDSALMAHNPGLSLPEDQAILLARYMVARWHAHDVLWILNGDGDYEGEHAARWRRIGAALFGAGPHAPTVLHPRGMSLPLDEFRDADWLDIVGYQSGHGDSDDTLRWLTHGPPAARWPEAPPRPFINLEPPYENHIAYHSRQPHSAHSVRRALYWSLLNAPTAGVTYGGHGVWGWDDGTSAPAAHPDTGTPLPWREALHMPTAEQMAHLAALFGALQWWRLRPEPNLLAAQPGSEPQRYCAAAATEDGRQALVYIPEDRAVAVRGPGWASARWFNPRTGEYSPAGWAESGGDCAFNTPAPGDWVLVLER